MTANSSASNAPAGQAADSLRHLASDLAQQLAALRTIVVTQKVSIGLMNALGACKELAQLMLDGQGFKTRTVSTDQVDYPALERLANGRLG